MRGQQYVSLYLILLARLQIIIKSNKFLVKNMIFSIKVISIIVYNIFSVSAKKEVKQIVSGYDCR